jgi:hypothetical protein
MKEKNMKRFVRAFCLVLAALTVLSITGCQGKAASGSLSFLKSENKVFMPENINKGLHLVDSKKLKYIAESGLISLYIDSQSYAVTVKESSQNKSWYSLPVKANDNYDYSAAVINLTVVSGNNTYYLNSQDNSVGFGTASYTSDDSSLTVKYIIAKDQKTASSSEYGSSDIAFSVFVKYTLKDGNLFVTSGWENLSKNTDIVIKDIGILEFFGASDTAEKGDFILVPDGCGALINTSVEDKNFKPLEFAVYGQDYANKTGSKAYESKLAAYGARQGKSGFAVLIENGDALAIIHADRATGTSGFNNVGARFNITPILDEEKANKTVRYIGESSFTDDIKMCFRFFNGTNASYSGMAIACREQLIRDKVLTVKTAQAGEYLPFNLSLIGAVKQPLLSFAQSLTKMKALTTFEQAQDLLIQMKAKGLNNVNLRYVGALSGGMDQEDITGAGIGFWLGRKSGFNELGEYMMAQNLSLFIDINIISTSKSSSYSSEKSAQNIQGEDVYMPYDAGLSEYLKTISFKRQLLAVSKLESNINRILKKYSDYNIGGFCINDAGSILYSDFSGDYINRQQAASMVSEQLETLSAGKSLMINSGNIRTVNSADVIVNMPLSTSVRESDAYSAVPFLQMILHGLVNYSGEPINLSEDSEKAMLRCIEFGACPSYEWCYEELDTEPQKKEKYFYGDWLTGAVSFYEKANKALADLTGARMTRHEMVAEGVYCTEYNDSSLVYVNYNDEDAKVGEITIEANSFLRIN